MRKEKGASLISIILVVLILAIIGFLAYQFWQADILGLREDNPLENIGSINTNQNIFIVSQVENDVASTSQNTTVGGSSTSTNMRWRSKFSK